MWFAIILLALLGYIVGLSYANWIGGFFYMLEAGSINFSQKLFPSTLFFFDYSLFFLYNGRELLTIFLIYNIYKKS